ncbi:MAG: family 20 glycosylhydrolase [Chitinophagaceae bacterium]
MKKILLLTIAASFTLTIQAQVGASAIIPAPTHVEEQAGYFPLSASVKITAAPSFKEVAGLLKEQLSTGSQNAASAVSNKNTAATITFSIANAKDSLGKEGYKLVIKPIAVSISAATPAGALKGMFTLLQLQQLQPDMQQLPCATIIDKPRFSYRGLHLDVSRHFYPASFVKKYIDLMALYKFNTFHWHLTDGAGWRLQIKKYPLLTQMAAFRSYNNWKAWWTNGRQYATEGEANAYGGYYTQEEAKEIVAYAARRGITVIPEIEMPGHSEEVLAAYPQLSCSGIAYKNSEFCIGNEETFSFLQDVLTEVMSVFPSTYIHVGGDEANTAAWKACPKCQQRKKDLGLTTEHQLQSYLIKRIENFLIAHNRKLIGWDEIMEGGLAPGATVMNWRDPKYGMQAAEQKHDVVITSAYYLDTYQSDPSTQPETIGGYSPLDKIYNHEPVPEAVSLANSQYYIGVQACVWTEYMPTSYQVEYMVYPRAIALAESAWTAKDKKNFDDFKRRLQYHYRLLQRLTVNYYRPSSYITINAKPDSSRKQSLVSFVSEQYLPEIHYTTDSSKPTINSPVYTQPFYTSGKTILTAAVFKNGLMLGQSSSRTVNYHKAIGKKVIFNNPWSESYPAQREATLTNGIEGSITYGDKQWLGYLKDFDATVDMDSSQKINSVAIRFMQQPGPGVFLPSYVELLTSSDGVNFTSAEKQINTISPKDPATIFITYTFNLKQQTARYLRIVAPNVQGGFMFTDEIIVY